MLSLFRKWFTPGVQLGNEDLKATIRLVVKLALGLFVAAVLLAGYVIWGSSRPTAVQDQAPDALVRAVIAVGVWGVICLVAYATIQAWDNTHRAAVLLHAQTLDDGFTRAARILASVLIDAAIILAAALVFGRVVGI